jgi:hypothetical protein
MSELNRPNVDVDALERELRRLQDMQKARAAHDPMAELARIVQADDPFAAAEIRRQPQPVTEPVARAAPEFSQPRGLPSEIRVARHAPSLQDFQPINRREPQSDAGYAAAPSTTARSYDDDVFVNPAYRPEPRAYDLDQEDLSPDIRLPPVSSDVAERREKRGSPVLRMLLPVVLVAGIGTGGWYAVGMIDPPSPAQKTADAPLIKAPEEPVKEKPSQQAQPEPTQQATRVLEEKQEDPKAPQSVVSAVEQPVDLKQNTPVEAKPQDGPRVIPLEQGQGAPVVVLPNPVLPKDPPAQASKPAEPPAVTEVPKPAEAAPQIAAVEPSGVVEPKPTERPVDPATAVEPEKPADVAVVEPRVVDPPAPPETPANPSAAPEQVPVATDAPKPVSRAVAMVPVAEDAQLIAFEGEDAPGPGAADAPKRVKSIRVPLADPNMTRSVTGQRAAATAEPDEAKIAAAEAQPDAAQNPAASTEPPAQSVEAAPPPAVAETPAAPAADEQQAAAVQEEPVAVPAPRQRREAQRERPRRVVADQGTEPTRRRAAEVARSDNPVSLLPSEAPAREQVASAGGGAGRFAVQFSAPPSQQDAAAEIRRISARFGVQARAIRAEVNGRTVYRVRAVGLSRADAVGLCERVKGGGGNCFVSGSN